MPIFSTQDKPENDPPVPQDPPHFDEEDPAVLELHPYIINPPAVDEFGPFGFGGDDITSAGLGLDLY